MVRGGGSRGGTSGSAAGGLVAVAEIEGADDVSASPSSSPAAPRQEHLPQQRLAQEHLHQQMLAAQAQAAQLAQLFPGGLQQFQAALPTLVGGNAPPPPSADLAAVVAALSQLDGRLASSFTALDARLQPLEAGLRSTQASLNAVRTSPDASRPRLSASPPVSDADSDSRSRASTDDADDSLEALLGNADPNFQHDLAQCGLSSPWALAVKSPGSKMAPDDIVNLSAFLITGRMVQYLAWLVLHLRDDPSSVSRQQIDDVLSHLDLARNTLIARLNHYQLLASGLDAKSAAALAAAAAYKRRVASHGDGVLAGLPIACPHLAELFADYQKKAMDKAVKSLHDPPTAKPAKPAASSDDDDIDSLRSQLAKAEARNKALAERLADEGRKHHGHKDLKNSDSKHSDSERPPAPKKTDKTKPAAQPASTVADASA